MLLYHAAHTPTMGGGDSVHGVHTQRVEIAGGDILIEAINLVHHDVKGLVALA